MVIRNGLLSIEDLTSWHRNTLLEERLFGPEGHDRITAARKTIDHHKLTIATVAWESPWAKSGGVAGIARLLSAAVETFVPKGLSGSAETRVLRISPFHERLIRNFEVGPYKTTTVVFDQEKVTVEIFKAVHDGADWYLFKDN